MCCQVSGKSAVHLKHFSKIGLRSDRVVPHAMLGGTDCTKHRMLLVTMLGGGCARLLW